MNVIIQNTRRQVHTNEDKPFYVRVSLEMKMDLIVGHDRRKQNFLNCSNYVNGFGERVFHDIILNHIDAHNYDEFQSIQLTIVFSYLFDVMYYLPVHLVVQQTALFCMTKFPEYLTN